MQKSKRLFSIFSIITSIAIAASVAGIRPNSTSVAASKIKIGGSIVIPITNEPDFLDPHLAVAAGTREILFNIFEGLVKPDSEGNLNPAVASSYKPAKNGLSYTFTLRKGIKFHNGKLVTVQDIKYSLDRAAGKGTGKVLQADLANIKSVDIKDSQTVQVNLIKPDTDFLASLTTAIIPKDYKDENKKPIGTGPFKFVKYTPQQELVVAKNKDYWKNGVPYLDKATFRIKANTDAAFLDLKAGNADLDPYIESDKAKELTDKYDVLKGNYNLVQLLALNNKVKPFNNIKVRQALSYVVEPKDIINIVGGGDGTQIGSGVFPGFKKYYQAGLEKTYKKNIKKAKELLKQAGYAKGFKFTITAPSNYKFHVDTAQVIAEELKQIGVTASIKQVEWGVWLDQVYKGRKYDATVIALDAAQLTAKALLGRYASNDPGNFINYKNANYDKIFNKAVSETDEAQKVKYYKELQTILTKDAASVFIQDPAKNVIIKKNLGGYKFYPLYVQDLSTIYYKK
jgi:peptide/nickel transport system substrate-binding protein